MPRRSSDSPGALLLAQRTISAVLLAFEQQGVPTEALGKICKSALRPKPEKRFRIPPSRDSALIGSALALWFRDGRFLGADGRPRPLRLLGRKPSVEHLLRTAGIRRNTKTIAKNAVESSLIVKAGNGRYLPTDRSAKITGFDGYLAEHIANGVLRLVETAHFNFSAKGKRAPLLQRAAAVRALPTKLRSSFRAYVNEQGNSFVTNIDDWLEAHSVRQTEATKLRRQPVAHAGVYAFAYFDP